MLYNFMLNTIFEKIRGLPLRFWIGVIVDEVLIWLGAGYMRHDFQGPSITFIKIRSDNRIFGSDAAVNCDKDVRQAQKVAVGTLRWARCACTDTRPTFRRSHVSTLNHLQMLCDIAVEWYSKLGLTSKWLLAKNCSRGCFHAQSAWRGLPAGPVRRRGTCLPSRNQHWQNARRSLRVVARQQEILTQ